ncbi:uroporphyrinogen-III synthase [Campylobacter sp. MIT 21-1685]|uniref:uroporphyrinogen-III synthase n=1 Tax=unclassified Campylobacter TaxID=2593542 RepID=UPI00224A5976|nr:MULTISPECIES: uroporphyrinogen-III synthase [unclassified Campylobacter]MCX2682396.1 uroporphyrinogen-III synthase [Campylobacter sp. MIT 21-1684]MCX2750676.1 uroporphyrinogen-III synthase [Campylobacter sp. MIT 21-1682]MCX2806776.1 uroporphyrinogen-III synthase [Campylobacter sp. MIT 21-1685]
MCIYLLNNIPFKGVINLVFNEIVYRDFTIDLSTFDALIITSKNALKALQQSNNALNFCLEIYAVGEKTAEQAKRLGFQKVYFPKKACASELVREFSYRLKEKKCLYLRADVISSHLDKDLIKLGVDLTQLRVYENRYKALKDYKLVQPCILIFPSPSSVENFLKQFQIHPKDTLIAIGESTASQLRAYGEVLLCEQQNLLECVMMAQNILKQISINTFS